ncbi:hypothetical protein FA13DRAFT_1793296 [Coprinellus micaceus]|uniref:Uncharacterized protein n=1 Tax=Coprinellus micaceus TaxID=71717 RepID=A0A4Y7T4U8_COPMI|nr:hypothetical protein FA13DRAFT_1793296 [Coprinellus micaceus]
MSLSRLPLPSFTIVLTEHRGASYTSVSSPKDEDPLMKTIDTRFSGSLTYDVDYAVAHPLRLRVPLLLPSRKTRDDAASIASSTSTNEVDLNSEFAADDNSVTSSDYEVGELGETNPPLHVQASSLARESPCCKCEADGIPMRVLRGSEAPTSSRQGRSQRDLKPRRNACLRIWLGILKAFRSLWRRLKWVGGDYPA